MAGNAHILNLRRQRDEALRKMRALVDKSKLEKRDLSRRDRTEFDSLEAEVKRLAEQIEEETPV